MLSAIGLKGISAIEVSIIIIIDKTHNIQSILDINLNIKLHQATSDFKNFSQNSRRPK